MSLCSPAKLLSEAHKNGQVVGAFNVGNMERIRGVIQAAEKLETPIIMQIGEKRLPHSPLDLLAPMMINAAKCANVDIAVQLDHAESTSIIEKALEYGFTGIMYDGSSFPLAENIKKTRNIVEMTKPLQAFVEGELGVLSGSEGGPEKEALYTDPDYANQFVMESGCGALAISIGNAHGHYKGKPKLNFNALIAIRKLVDIPLVLHGGSGIPEEDFSRAVNLGICKINIATANFDAYAKGTRNAINENAEDDYFSLSAAMVHAVYKNTCEHIQMFNKM